jgi:hypothetical protein
MPVIPSPRIGAVDVSSRCAEARESAGAASGFLRRPRAFRIIAKGCGEAATLEKGGSSAFSEGNRNAVPHLLVMKVVQRAKPVRNPFRVPPGVGHDPQDSRVASPRLGNPSL